MATGGIGFTIMSSWFGVSLSYASLVGGVGLVLTAIFNPEGIAGANRILFDKRDRRLPIGGRRSEPWEHRSNRGGVLIRMLNPDCRKWRPRRISATRMVLATPGY